MHPEGADRVLSELGHDLRPARPLRLARRCFPALAALGLTSFVLLWWSLGLRTDREIIGVLGLWGISGIGITGGLLLLSLALREAFPGRNLSLAVLSTVAVVAGASHLTLCWLTTQHSPLSIPASQELGRWLFCLCLELGLGTPMALLAMAFVRGGLISFPWRAGLLAGFGAGLVGDAIWRLICPHSELDHVLPAHTGGILAVVAVSLLVSRLWDRTRLQGWSAYRQAQPSVSGRNAP